MKLENNELKLLNILEKRYNTKYSKPFRGYICIFIQHLLGSNLSLIRSLEKGGIEKNKLYIIGKAYSSNDDVLEYLKNKGYNYKNPIQGYSIDTCYDEIFKNEIRETLFKVLESSNLPVLLIDDAAKGICIVHEKPFLKHISRFKCVELTTRGIRELRKLELKCPVVDVASSYAKRNVESVIIAESMTDEFLRFLHKWNDYYRPQNNHILLIGYGAIGRRVYKRLSSLYHITVYDIDEQVCVQAQEENVNITYDITTEHYGIIIGCTGLSINLEQLLQHSGTLFINMSSSDLEFGLWRFRGYKEHMRIRLNAPLIERRLHEFYYIKKGNKEFYIANGGFPIDFTGSIDPIIPSKIQITRALVFAAAIQTLTEKEAGLINLNKEIQKELIKNYSL